MSYSLYIVRCADGTLYTGIRGRCGAARDAAQWREAKRRALYLGAAAGATGLSGPFRDALGRFCRGSAHQAAHARREAAAASTARVYGERDLRHDRDRRGAAGLMCAITGQRGRRCCCSTMRRGGREDPDLRRRALQLHQPATARRSASFRPIRISPSRRWTATPSTTSSRWSTPSHPPFTRRRSVSCSATARPAKSSRCCSRNAPRRG